MMMREAAALLERDKAEKQDFHYLAKVKPDDVIKAVLECVHLMRRSKHWLNVRQGKVDP